MPTDQEMNEDQQLHATPLTRPESRRRRSKRRSDSRKRRRRGSSSASPSSKRRRRGRTSGRRHGDSCSHRRRNKKRLSTVSTSSTQSESDSSNNEADNRKSHVNNSRRKHKQNKDHEATTGVSAREILEILKSLPTSTSQNHFSMNNNAVPEFDPSSKEQTISVWINKVEECAKLYGWNETQLLHYALPKLVGVARVWYQGLPSVNFPWSEWKDKLLKTFPSVENYAVLLNEMLERKVKYNESLETYFYHKINLLNRCEIYGTKAVDCVIQGLEDRGMRLGAQAANYSQPEQLLAYLKTIKNEDVKDNRRFPIKKRTEIPNENGRSVSNTIKCFNCGEPGHPSFKCSKPLLSCNICKRIGHQSSSCWRLSKTNDNKVNNRNGDKSVSEIKLVGSLDNKYVLTIKVNDKCKTCYVDLGSQSTLMRQSDFEDLCVPYVKTDLSSLRGFGGTLINPIGKAIVKITVQDITADTEIYIVANELLKYPVLLGHTFTERTGIMIIKTDEQLVFVKQPKESELEVDKFKIFIQSDIIVKHITAVPIQVEKDVSCSINVRGSMRQLKTNEYYIMPGVYNIINGRGFIMIVNLGTEDLVLTKYDLLTRAQVIKDKDAVNILRLEEETKLTFDQISLGETLTPSEILDLQKLLDKYKDCFSFSLSDLGLTHLLEMTITLKDTTPVVYRPYRLAHTERQNVKGMIQEMLDTGIITESTSSYASPILLVQKKTGDKRLCVDYRALNAKTIKEHYPLPRIDDQIDSLGGFKYFVTLDLASGYYQIPIASTCQDKTAFVTPDGQYQFTRMPFGLANAPSIFQKTINKMLGNTRNHEAFAFMDDIIIPSESVQQGMERLEAVLKLLREAGLTLKITKCKFFYTTIDYLGYEISKAGVRPGTTKTEAVEKYTPPRNQHEIRQFLGLVSFFRRFVKSFAIIAAPLTRLLKKDVKWEWGPGQEKAFKTLKEELINRPILAIFDPLAKTQIHTDACKTGIAGMLLQEDKSGSLRAVAYYSRQTSPEEQKYHSFELETLAVIASLSRFRVYVLGLKFTIVTDCNALRTTLTKRDIIPRICRWWLQLQEYDCQIEYRPGSRMSHVDALSRNAIEPGNEPETVFDILTMETEDWLVTMQNVDDEIIKIKQILEDPETKDVVDVQNNYRLKGGRVYRVVNDQLKWMVPKGVRWQLLKKNHDDLGHFGVDKTLNKLQDLYWFPKMRRFVQKYVKSCLECSYYKTPAGKKQGMLHPIPKIEEPFHTIHLDHLGPFIKSTSKNTYILVLIDAYSRYINLYGVRNTKTKTTLKVLNSYVSLFGVPSRIISDRGTSFTSRSFKEFIGKLGIRHVLNAVATPRANGQVERYNRTILASLATKNHNYRETEWDKHLEEIQLGLNTTVNKTTGKSPSEILFGLRLRTKGDSKVSSLLDCDRNNTKPLEDIRKEVNLKVADEQIKQKRRFDCKRKKAKIYKIGDLVRIEKEIGTNNGKSRKLLPKLQGPYRIVKVLNNDRYIVEDTPLTRKQNRRYEAVISVDNIHPWLTYTQDYLNDTEDEELSKEIDSTQEVEIGNDTNQGRRN